MKTIITIGRQYGSGGKEIGRRVAEALGVPFYDEELAEAVAESTNAHPDVVKSADEKATNSFLYSIVTSGRLRGINDVVQYEMPINDKVFINQSKYIKEIAKNGGCVIVGRCADYVLRKAENRISIFIYAPTDFKVKRIIERHEGIDEKAAKELSQKTDKRRINYYNYYTGKKWGSPENYQIMIDSSVLGVEGTAQALAAIIKAKYGI